MMKLPGPDHPITITPANARVRVSFAGQLVADTTRALILEEAGYAPVFYIPRDDADMSAFTRSEHRTHCPYKGDASHFTLDVLGKRAENAAWSYEQPYPAMREIEGRLAFYPKRVDAIEVLPA
jgi:uncharacterized protein (DUF427 family)